MKNAPTIDDKSFTRFELGGGIGDDNLALGASFEGNEWYGTYGIVYIANDIETIVDSKGNVVATAYNLYQRTYVHELGNLLSRRISPDGSGATFGDPNNSFDDDTGYQLEECVFGDVRP